jgi:hypothetical protein
MEGRLNINLLVSYSWVTWASREEARLKCKSAKRDEGNGPSLLPLKEEPRKILCARKSMNSPF